MFQLYYSGQPSLLNDDERSLSSRFQGTNVPLSPLPSVKAGNLSPRRKVAEGVFVSPLALPGVPASPSRPMRYSFSRSPYKVLTPPDAAQPGRSDGMLWLERGIGAAENGVSKMLFNRSTNPARR